jgi:hypothetical protein
MPSQQPEPGDQSEDLDVCGSDRFYVGRTDGFPQTLYVGGAALEDAGEHRNHSADGYDPRSSRSTEPFG